MPWIKETRPLSAEDIVIQTERAAREPLKRICSNPQKVLLLPPDITRAHSGSGRIAEILYNFFSPTAEVHLIPTLGQHVPHTPEQNKWMFGNIPE